MVVLQAQQLAASVRVRTNCETRAALKGVPSCVSTALYYCALTILLAILLDKFLRSTTTDLLCAKGTVVHTKGYIELIIATLATLFCAI